ncbi:MAG: GNAT family N-acetyltransferase [Gemmatimonadaceae bacterium]|nr:GNAT family N-acetyltransferase [Gemmatimonadaceae bacterium]
MNWFELPMPDLETERLTLRSYKATDAKELQRLAGQWEVADTTQRIPHPYPDGAAEEWIAKLPGNWKAGEQAIWAITVTETGALLGSMGLTLAPAHRSAELGYWITPSEWGKGYATEAAQAALTFGMSTLGLWRVHAHYLVRNPASGAVLRKLGMTHEGTLRAGVWKWDRPEDLIVCSILAPEWRVQDSIGSAANE